MVGYNRIPTARLRREATLGFLAALAERRARSEEEAASSLGPSHPFRFPPFPIHATRLCPPLPVRPSAPSFSSLAALLLPPLAPRPAEPDRPRRPHRAVKLPLSFVSPPSLPADSHGPHTRYARATSSFPLGELRSSSSSFPSRPPARRPCLPSPGQGNAGSLRIQTTEHEVTTRQI